MADSETTVCNMALRHLGIAKEIANLTERSAEAQACSRFFAQVRDEVLRDFPWPFATVIDTLALVTDHTSDDSYEWAYDYRYPSDALLFRRILSGTRNDSRQTAIAYRIKRDDDGRLIATDVEDAQGEWTTVVDDVTQWPPDFTQSVSFLLAGYIAPSVSAGDQFRMGDRAFTLYQASIQRARANAKNEELRDEPPDSEFVSSRN